PRPGAGPRRLHRRMNRVRRVLQEPAGRVRADPVPELASARGGLLEHDAVAVGPVDAREPRVDAGRRERRVLAGDVLDHVQRLISVAYKGEVAGEQEPALGVGEVAIDAPAGFDTGLDLAVQQ